MKDRRLKILWSSNGFFTNSGYGVETKELLYRFLEDGWPTEHIAFFGLESFPQEMFIKIGGREKEFRTKVYPKMGDAFGSDALFFAGQDSKANVIFTMQDVWTLNPEFLSKIKNWIPYTPIDANPIPPLTLDRLKYAYKIITFSKFGQETLHKYGFSSTLIVEGTNVDTFKPMDKAEMRKLFNIPQDAFLFGMIGANKENPPRKGYQEALEAFSIFAKNHNEARIMFHTQQMSPSNFPILDYAKHLGVADKVTFVDAYRGTYFFDSDMVAKEINCFDVLLHPSLTEGFGLLIIEAQACGKPVIVNNATSQPELVIPGKTGEICDAGGKFFTTAGAFWTRPSIPSLIEKMETVYKRLHEPNTYAKDCRDHIVQNYNLDTLVKERWIPLLEELQGEILGKPQIDNQEKK